MEHLLLSEAGIEAAARRAAAVLAQGGIVLYPTDTLYGLGADAFSDEAVARLYEMKKREAGKPVHAIVSDMEMAARYGEVETARKLANKLPKGKITFVVRKKDGVESGIGKGMPTFGFRIPDDAFCNALTKSFGKPVSATSANISGAPSCLSVADILAQLGDKAQGIDLAVDAGEIPPREPSSVVDLSGREPNVLREAAVSARDIFAALGNLGI